MSLTKASSYNELVSNILIAELQRNKIDRIFISPGLRSTPLTTSVAKNSKLTKHIHFDERGSAFAALGYAKATGKPGVLICTSGSAGTNYFPAICEASADAIPMIVLTADRPPELHNVLANQTLNQENLFGNQVRGFLNIYPPDKNISLSDLLENFSSLIQQALHYPNGPVHINCMFREPLEIKNKKKDYSKLTVEIKNWIASDKPYLKQKPDKTKISFDTHFDTKTPTILIAGALKSKQEARAVVAFAEKLNLPIFPDIRSGLRLSNNSKNIISHYDQLLLTKALDVNKLYQIIHVGGNIISKRLLQFIEKTKIVQYLVLHNSKEAYDSHHKMTSHTTGRIEKLLEVLSTTMIPFDTKIFNKLVKYNHKVNSIMSKYEYKFSEIAITRQLSQLAKNNSFIYSANSLSVRLLDIFGDANQNNNIVVANRGLSGIDGTIASVVGYAQGAKKRGTLLIGDLAFLHDLNSLALVKKSDYPIVIVLLNNNGGKIFSYLPVAKDTTIFTEYFDTPQNLLFKSSANQFDLPYYFISSTRQFIEIYSNAQKLNQSVVIEVALQDSLVLKEQKQIEKELLIGLKLNDRF